MPVLKYKSSSGTIQTLGLSAYGQGPAGPAGPAGNISMKHATVSFSLASGPSAVFYLVKVGGNYVSANDYFITSSCGGVNQPVMCTPWTSPNGYLGCVTSNFWQQSSGTITVTIHVAIGRYDGTSIANVELEEYTH